MPRKKKLYLEDCCLDFDLFGIEIRKQEEHRWIYWINKTLETHFERVNNLTRIEKQEPFDFLVYEWTQAETEETYTLIRNQSIPQFSGKNENDLDMLFPKHIPFLKSMPHYSFLLRILPFGGANLFENLSLKNNAGVLSLTPIPLESIPDSGDLVF